MSNGNGNKPKPDSEELPQLPAVPCVLVWFSQKERKVRVGQNLKQGWEGAVDMLLEAIKLARVEERKQKKGEGQIVVAQMNPIKNLSGL